MQLQYLKFRDDKFHARFEYIGVCHDVRIGLLDQIDKTHTAIELFGDRSEGIAGLYNIDFAAGGIWRFDLVVSFCFGFCFRFNLAGFFFGFDFGFCIFIFRLNLAGFLFGFDFSFGV